MRSVELECWIKLVGLRRRVLDQAWWSYEKSVRVSFVNFGEGNSVRLSLVDLREEC